jgi:hypothetical protein
MSNHLKSSGAWLGAIAAAASLTLAVTPSASAAGQENTATSSSPTANYWQPGKTVQTANVICHAGNNYVYYDDYDNYPGDWYNQKGYRVHVGCAKQSLYHPNKKVVLVTSCSYGFTYKSAPKWITGSGYNDIVDFTNPDENQEGCSWGVSNYWIEEVA